MEKAKTLIEFVYHGGTIQDSSSSGDFVSNNSSLVDIGNSIGASTGDANFWMLSIFLVFIIGALCIFVRVKKPILNTLHANLASCVNHQKLQKLLVIIAALFLTGGLMFVSSLGIHAYAQSGDSFLDASGDGVYSSNKVIAHVYEDTKTVSIDSGTVGNNDFVYSYLLQQVALYDNDSSVEGTWALSVGEQIIYAGSSGQCQELTSPILIETQKASQVDYHLDIDFDAAKKLCGTTPISAEFSFQKINKMYGHVIDDSSSSIIGAQVQYTTNTTKTTQTVFTDDTGKFVLDGSPFEDGSLVVSAEGKIDSQINIVPVTQDFDCGDIVLYDSASISGLLSVQLPSIAHDFSVEDTDVVFEYIDQLDNKVKKTVPLNKDYTYKIDCVPYIASNPVKGIISCRKDGYYFQKDVVVDSLQVEVNGALKHGLDNYTIEELTYISDDISFRGQASGYYLEFQNYIQSDELWLSNSNSQQSDQVTSQDTSLFDPTKCNQLYKNNFQIDEGIIVPENQDMDQFLILRIIGINQDDISNTNGKATGKKAGLTFQSIRSLPQSYSISSNDSACLWWGDSNCSLRSHLSSQDGLIYGNLCEPLKNNIVNVAKLSQTQYSQQEGINTASVVDKMFPLSYTEMTTRGTHASRFDNYDYYKDNTEGQQYDWYKCHNVLGNDSNQLLAKLGCVNSEEGISQNLSIAYQRSTYYQAANMFLTISEDGALYSYDYSASNKNGIAPAFCLGTMSQLNTISLNNDSVRFMDLDNNELDKKYYCANNQDFSFKIVPDSGYTIENVFCDGVEIQAVEEIYTIPNITQDHSITVKLGGEGTKTTIISGTTKLEKNGIGEGAITITNLSNVDLEVVDEHGTIYGQATSDDSGQFRIICDPACVGKKGYLKTSYCPGILSYTSQELSFKEALELNIEPHINGLDYYSIPELQSIGLYLSNLSADELESNKCYQEFHSYLENDIIWYSNSNGQQPKTVNSSNTEDADMSKCNVNGAKCNFVDGDTIDNFLFCRIIGIRHDPRKDGALSGYCGLTMQTIRCIPVSFTASSTWWGEDTDIYAKIKRGGEIFEKMSADFKTWLVDNKKFSQKDYDANPNIVATDDWMFIPSYSEMWETNGAMTKNAIWYDNGSGQQQGEGRVYEWYKLHRIDGGNYENDILKKMSATNSGDTTYTDKGTTWLRSIFYDGTSTRYHMAQRSGFINSYNYDFSKSVICPCICF